MIYISCDIVQAQVGKNYLRFTNLFALAGNESTTLRRRRQQVSAT